jgi:hypothetical protein
MRTLVYLLVLILLLAACNPGMQERRNAAATLTVDHGTEVQQIVERTLTFHFLDRGDTPPESIATGPALEFFNRLSPPSKQGFTITSLYVIEYTPQIIKVSTCARFDGARFGRNYFDVDLIEDGVWKLYTSYSISDPDSPWVIWQYASAEEKQIVGDLQQYVDDYSTGPDL